MKWWHRLSYKLTGFILLLAIVPLAGFGITTIKEIRKVRLDSVAQIHRGIATDSAKKITASIADTIKEVQLVINSNELESLDVLDQEWFLQLLIKAIPHLYTLTLTESNGQERVKVGRDRVYNPGDLERHADHPVFHDSKETEPQIGQLHRNQNNILIMDLYIPLLSPMDRKVTAVLEVAVDIEKLLSFTADLRIGKTGYVYVVDEKGKFLVHPDHSVVLAGEDALKNPLVMSFISGRDVSETNKTYINRKQVEVLSNARAVTEPKLLVVTVQSMDEALAAVTRVSNRQAVTLMFVIAVAILLSLYFIIKINRPLGRLESGAQRIGTGHLSHRIPVTSSDEIGTVTRSFNAMADDLESAKKASDNQNWVRQGVVELDSLLRGELSLKELCTHVITFMAGYLEEQVGIIYVHDGMGGFDYTAGYAFKPGKGFLRRFSLGQGLPGQAALEQKLLTISDVPPEYIRVTSGLGNKVPGHLCIIPFVFNDAVEAVMELGSLKELTKLQQKFIRETADGIAIIIAAARSRQELNKTLVQTRAQAEELQRQQEELQAANEEMEEQTQMLTASESKLKEQQEELQAANEELEEKTEYLERNKKNIEEKNQTLVQLGEQLEKKAEDLSIASKYKSEFLANMSHELRTPLNSLLLLSRMLTDNKEGNLLDDQVDSARIIYNSGNDLLSLINEILDLSKIEAGKMQLSLAEIPLTDLKDSLGMNFKELAREKNLSLDISIRAGSPDIIVTDQLRILQILKNFIANAFKFTETGGITVEFYRPDNSIRFSRSELTPANSLAVDVTDTGIGIPEEKQKIIFEAFQQVEGGSARKYGGTGLGLSISRELVNLLGGEISLASRENAGATFTLYLPIKAASSEAAGAASHTEKSDPEESDKEKSRAPAGKEQKSHKSQKQLPKSPADDRDHIGPDDRAILIIEDDANFAETLLKFCREKGFKGIITPTGEEGLKLVESFKINAIVLDIHLPGIDGWTVLATLKENSSTRHIPVHFMSADDPVPEAFTRGAMGYLTKPVTPEDLETVMANLESMINKKMKDLLLVEDNANQRHAIAKLISDSDVVIHEVSTGKDALKALQKKTYDCMILDLGLPDMSGFDLLKKMETDNRIHLPPVVVYTGRELTKKEEQELRRYSDSIIIKGVRSEERLLDETSLFLHRVVEKMPEEKRKMITALHDPDQALQGSTILIVDDDMRNVFALSKVLKAKGADTLKAENGIKALEMLEVRNDVDLVLMDIMMPVMDGYETMRKIRAQAKFGKLPIIALTAKAMQRDKEECIAAGANDYLAKPVDIDRLLSMMRVWLYR